jgi:hypothetical protein
VGTRDQRAHPSVLASRPQIAGNHRGIEFKIFDYGYRQGYGKDSTFYSQTVILLRSPHLALAAFALGPEGLLDKLSTVFGGQDIDFASHPTFSRRYRLRGQPEAAIRQCFVPRALDYFDRNHGLSVEAMEGELVVYRASKRLRRDGLRELIDRGLEIHDLFAAIGTRASSS